MEVDDSLQTDMQDTTKIIILGGAGVGKSSLMTRYVEKKFLDISTSTIGVDFKKADIKGRNFTIWDTAGSERFRGVATSYFKGASGIIVVFDITNKASFENCDLINDEIRSYAEKDVTIILAGNKSDLAGKKVVMQDDINKKEKKLRAKAYFEVSAKVDQEKVNQMFERLAEEIEKQEKMGGGIGGGGDGSKKGMSRVDDRGERLSDSKSQKPNENGEQEKKGCGC